MENIKRITFKLNIENERERAIYNALSASHLPMSRIVKDALFEKLVQQPVNSPVTVEAILKALAGQTVDTTPTNWQAYEKPANEVEDELSNGLDLDELGDINL